MLPVKKCFSPEIHFGPFCLPYFTKRSYSAVLIRHTHALPALSVCILVINFCVKYNISKTRTSQQRAPNCTLSYRWGSKSHTLKKTASQYLISKHNGERAGIWCLCFIHGHKHTNSECEAEFLCTDLTNSIKTFLYPLDHIQRRHIL